MKKIAAIIALVLFALFEGRAQNSHLDYKYALKVYNQTTYEGYHKIRESGASSPYLNHATTALQLLQPTVGVQWKGKKNNYHEIGFMNFSAGKTSTSAAWSNDALGNPIPAGEAEVASTYISLQYEHTTNFRATEDAKLVPALGAGLNPYFRQHKTSPELASLFPSSEQYYGMRVFVTPRITYFINSKLFIDLNTPLCFLEMYAVTDKVEDPSLPANQRTTNDYAFQQFPKVFTARLGLGLKL